VLLSANYSPTDKPDCQRYFQAAWSQRFDTYHRLIILRTFLPAVVHVRVCQKHLHTYSKHKPQNRP